MNVPMLFFVLFVTYLKADIPSACDPKTEINGTWTFHIGAVVDRFFNCSSINVNNFAVEEDVTVNVAIDRDGSHNVYLGTTLVGRWTSMDVEGFDVFIRDLHYQAYFKFYQDGRSYLTNCSQTLGGWVRQDVVRPDEFRCFWGEKSFSGINENNRVYARSEEDLFINNRRLGRKYVKPINVGPAEPLRASKGVSLPEELDWSNFNGINYVDPVYDQGSCGSCFAFGSLSALEARLLVFTKGTVKKSLSQQDIVSCSHYSQGCDGGFTEEVGYWSKDHGIVDNLCYPYTGKQTACAICNNPTYYYASNVSYVGGYFGACSEQLMLEALQDGPIAVGINASPREFSRAEPGTIIESNSTGGINHSVLLVGYGEENGKLFWKIKNSWGTSWADAGYGRILRGQNTLKIETEAEIINPVIDAAWIKKESSTPSFAVL